MMAMIKMVVVLSLICAMSGFALAYLKGTTAPKIEEQVLTYVQSPAITSVYHLSHRRIMSNIYIQTKIFPSAYFFPFTK